MVNGFDYVEQGLEKYQAQVIETKRRSLCRLARQLGMKLPPAHPSLGRVSA
jgi:hypothetical protein